MLILLNTDHVKVAGLTEYRDLNIKKEINMDDTLSFSFPNLNSKMSLLQEEAYIQTEDAEYIIKEINYSGEEWADIICKLNLEDLKGNIIDTFNSEEKTCTQAVNLALAGTGWSINSCTILKSRTVRKNYCSVYDILKEIQDIYKCEMQFNNVDKEITIKEYFGSDKGVYFAEQLNLKHLSIQRNSYSLITRLIPIGKGGLDISTVNSGVKYISNNQYCDKILTGVWEDNRYTDAQTLKDDAIERLSFLSMPYKSYDADIYDLAKISQDYDILDYTLGDTITLLSQSKNIKEKQRIIQIKLYPDEPERNTCQIANRLASLDDIQTKLIDDSEIFETVTTQEGQLDGKKIDGVDWTKINNVLIKSADIQDAAIVEAKIGNLAVTDAKIASLNASKIAAGTITADKIAANTIQANSGVIANGAITTAMLGTAVVDTSNIKDAAIIDAKIVSLSANKLTAGTIDAGTITVTNLVANNITTGTLNGDRLADDTIINRMIADGAVKNANIYAATITGDKLVAETITAREIAAGTITANKMVAGTITAASGIIADAAIINAKIASIDASKITTGFLSADRIETGSITAAKLAKIGDNVLLSGTNSRIEIDATALTNRQMRLGNHGEGFGLGVYDTSDNTKLAHIDLGTGQILVSELTSSGPIFAPNLPPVYTGITSIWVNATTGNDSSGTGTSGAPYKTISRALDEVNSHILNYNVNIYIAAGTYNEDVIVDTVGGRYTLTIIHDDASSNPVLVNGIFDAKGCSCYLIIRGRDISNKYLRFYQENSTNYLYAVRFWRCGHVLCQYVYAWCVYTTNSLYTFRAIDCTHIRIFNCAGKDGSYFGVFTDCAFVALLDNAGNRNGGSYSYAYWFQRCVASIGGTTPSSTNTVTRSDSFISFANATAGTDSFTDSSTCPGDSAPTTKNYSAAASQSKSYRTWSNAWRTDSDRPMQGGANSGDATAAYGWHLGAMWFTRPSDWNPASGTRAISVAKLTLYRNTGYGSSGSKITPTRFKRTTSDYNSISPINSNGTVNSTYVQTGYSGADDLGNWPYTDGYKLTVDIPTSLVKDCFDNNHAIALWDAAAYYARYYGAPDNNVSGNDYRPVLTITYTP